MAGTVHGTPTDGITREDMLADGFISLPILDENTEIIPGQRKAGANPQLNDTKDAWVWSDYSPLILISLSSGNLLGVGSGALGIFG